MCSQAKDAVQILQSNRKIIIISLGIQNHIQTDASNTNHMFAHRSYFCQLSLSQLWIRRTHPKLLRHWAIFIFLSLFVFAHPELLVHFVDVACQRFPANASNLDFFQLQKLRRGYIFISSRNVKRFKSNTSKHCCTIWLFQHHLNCGVEKLNHRVESVQERVKAMENHLLLDCGGKCEKKNSKKKDLHLKLLAFGKKSESNHQIDRFAPEIPNIWPLSLGPYNTTAVLSCTPIYSSCKISFNKIGQRGVMSI